MTTVRRTHPVSIIFEALGVGPRDAILFVVLIVSTGFWWLILLGILIAVGVATMRWLKMSWSFDGATVVVDKGVLHRSHREIPVNRIQQVELIRTLRHQMLGMTTVRIETSGGATRSELELEVVPYAEGEEIRSTLLHARDRARAGALNIDASDPVDGHRIADLPPPPARTLLELPMSRLAIAGLSGPQLLALPLALAWLINAAGDLPDEMTPDVNTDVAFSSGAIVVALVVVALIVMWIIVAVLAGVIAYFDLRVTLVGQDVRIQRGLFDRRDVSIPIGRIQTIQLTSHPVHRLLGLVDLRISSAGQHGHREASRHAVIPVVDASELASLIEVMLPDASPLPELLPAPRRAMSRQVTRLVIPLAFVATVAIATTRPWGFVALLLVAFGSVRGVLTYRGLGASGFGPVIAGRHGALVRRTHLVPVRKLQSVRRTATFFQRRRHLATVAFDVAGVRSAPALFDRDEAEVDALLEALAHSDAPRRDDAALRQDALTDDPRADGAPTDGATRDVSV